jgi:hypothetical protein
MMRRFCQYIEKVFHVSDLVRELTDERERAQIPTWSVWMSAFMMLAMRRGSLNALESDMRVAKRLDGIIGRRKPSADTVGRVFSVMYPGVVRWMLGRIVHSLARNKALARVRRLRFIAFDGHWFFSLTTPLVRGM